MPQRAFVTATLEQLTDPTTGIIGALEKAQKSGGVHTLRNNNTGFITQANIRSDSDIDRRYTQARYEAYLRVKGLDDDDPNKAALVLQWTNPYREKVMSVDVCRGSAIYTAIP